MGNKTECTGFLARTTIKPETKAGLDKTESIMVRRISRKWNFHASDPLFPLCWHLTQPLLSGVMHWLVVTVYGSV
jgi:hypothetical protein